MRVGGEGGVMMRGGMFTEELIGREYNEVVRKVPLMTLHGTITS